MEEKAKKGAKTLKKTVMKVVEKKPRNESTGEATEASKLTYEQLEQIANQLTNENRQLYERMNEMNMANAFKRLDYLFKVGESPMSFSLEFIDRCTKEIEGLMTLPEKAQPEDASKDETK